MRSNIDVTFSYGFTDRDALRLGGPDGTISKGDRGRAEIGEMDDDQLVAEIIVWTALHAIHKALDPLGVHVVGAEAATAQHRVDLE